MNIARWTGGIVVACVATWTLGASALDLPGPVVSAQWLNEHAQEVVIIDVRDDLKTWTDAPEYEKDEKTGASKLTASGGHIAGALPLDFGRIRVGRTEEGKKIDKMLPERSYVQDLMQSTGVAKDRPIVITSPGEAVDNVDAAARVYWTLKYYGASRLALLDGGNSAWILAGFAVSTEPTVPARGDWEATTERHELLAQMADVEKAMKDKLQLVDARPPSQYLGVTFKKPAVTAPGHLDGAHDLPGDLRVRPSGLAQQFLTPAEYRAVFKAQGINVQAPTITYCNTGHMAAGAWFIQSEILGGTDVRVYDGSMHEWTTLGRPVVGLGG